MCPGDVWGWRGLWWGFTWRYSIINQGLTMGTGPRLRSCHLPANPLEPPFPPHCSPLPRPTWSHAEASDDADHAGHADVAHPGQGGLQGDTGLETLALSCTPSTPGTRLHAALGLVVALGATQDVLVRCRQAMGGVG